MKNLTKLILATTSLALFIPTNKSSAQVYFSYNFAGGGTFDFDYGTWTGQYTPGPSYITVAGTATTSGGAGKNVPNVDITLTPPANTYIVIRARLLPSHNGSDIRLSLNSSGTDFSVWAAPAALFNTTTFTTVQIPISTTPVFTSGSLDLTQIISYNVQGDFFSPGNFAVEIEFLSIIPEPKSVALASMVLLMIGSIAFRASRRSSFSLCNS